MSLWLEDFIGTQGMLIAGNPLFIGILVLAFFTALVLVRRSNLEVRVLAIGGGFLLALAFFPSWLIVLFAMGLAIVMYLAIIRLITR